MPGERDDIQPVGDMVHCGAYTPSLVATPSTRTRSSTTEIVGAIRRSPRCAVRSGGGVLAEIMSLEGWRRCKRLRASERGDERSQEKPQSLYAQRCSACQLATTRENKVGLSGQKRGVWPNASWRGTWTRVGVRSTWGSYSASASTVGRSFDYYKQIDYGYREYHSAERPSKQRSTPHLPECNLVYR